MRKVRQTVVVTLLLLSGGSLAVPVASADAKGAEVDRICQQARSRDHKPGRCAVATGSATGAPARPTVKTLSRSGDLRALNSGMTLRDAAARSAVYCRTWKQWQRGLYYINWKEEHSGRFCYNGRDVWIDSVHGAYHRCDQGYGVLYDIQVKNCTENKLYVNTRPGYGFQNWDYYRVHVAWKGIPLYQSHDMHANVYPSGNVYFKS